MGTGRNGELDNMDIERIEYLLIQVNKLLDEIMMDNIFNSTYCISHLPHCDICPFEKICYQFTYVRIVTLNIKIKLNEYKTNGEI